jgi:SAM-dependent methyltransferase
MRSTMELLTALVHALSNRPKYQHCGMCGRNRLHLWTSPHYVVGLRCLGCRSVPTHRAVWSVLENLFPQSLPEQRVLQIGGHGALHEALRGACPLYTPTEYFPHIPLGEMDPSGVECQDVRRLTYPDRSFDLVVSTEVFEHVGGYHKGFSEIRRVLKPGGYHIFRVPLDHIGPTRIRVREEPDGTLIHLLPTVYHGDPLRPVGALVFQDFGPDICQILGDLGLPAELYPVELDVDHGPVRVIVSRRPE